MIAFQGYYPEMGEAKPACHIEAHLSHSGSHYFIRTDLELSGRGIKLIKPYAIDDYTAQSRYDSERKKYQVTELALEKLSSIYTISYEMLLD